MPFWSKVFNDKDFFPTIFTIFNKKTKIVGLLDFVGCGPELELPLNTWILMSFPKLPLNTAIEAT